MSSTLLTNSKLAEIEQKYKRLAGDWNGTSTPSEHNAWLTGLSELVTLPLNIDTPVVKIGNVYGCSPSIHDLNMCEIDRYAKLMGVYEIKYPVNETVSVWLLLSRDKDTTVSSWVMLRRLADNEAGDQDLPRLVTSLKEYTRDEYAAKVINVLRQNQHQHEGYNVQNVANSFAAALSRIYEAARGHADILDHADDMYERTLDICPEAQAGNAIQTLTQLMYDREIKLVVIGKNDTSLIFRLEPQKSANFNYIQGGAVGGLWWINRGVATAVCQLITNDAEFMRRFNAVFARRGYRLDIVADRDGDLIEWQVNLVKLLEK